MSISENKTEKEKGSRDPKHLNIFSIIRPLTLSVLFILLSFQLSASSKKGYVIEIITSQYKNEMAYLSLHKGDKKLVIDSCLISSRGKAKFKSKKNYLMGEYEIGTKEQPFFRLFFSHSELYYKEKIELGSIDKTIGPYPEVIKHQGSEENAIYLKYQQMLNGQWKNYSSGDEFADHLIEIIKQGIELEGSIVKQYFLFQFPEQADGKTEIIEQILNDKRLINTSILHTYLKNQLNIFNNYSPDDIILLCDVIIQKSREAEIQIYLAYTIFEHFYNSNIMGHESVSVHIADNYFLNDRLKWPDEGGMQLLKLFADFNRSSLIGMNAPSIALYTPTFEKVSITDVTSPYKILYFYNDNCSVCKAETPRLIELLSDIESDYSLFFIYTESDQQRMTEYNNQIKELLIESGNGSESIYFLWDPASESGYERLYSVLRTPQLFLLDDNNTIIGRNLSADNLLTLIEENNSKKNEYPELFDSLFNDKNENEIKEIVDYFYITTYNDPRLYREIMYQLYLYFDTINNDSYKEGLDYLVKKYIIEKSYFWENESINGAKITGSDFIDQLKRTHLTK